MILLDGVVRCTRVAPKGGRSCNEWVVAHSAARDCFKGRKTAD